MADHNQVKKGCDFMAIGKFVLEYNQHTLAPIVNWYRVKLGQISRQIHTLMLLFYILIGKEKTQDLEEKVLYIIISDNHFFLFTFIFSTLYTCLINPKHDADC